MPRLETKTMTVHPSTEAEIIDFIQNFGWDLKNNQEVLTQNTRLEDGGFLDTSGNIYSVTETTHYIKLTFQRNTEMRNYAEIVKLEREYNDIPKYPAHPVRFGFFWGVISLMFFIGFVSAIGQFLSFFDFEYMIGGIFCASVIIWRIVRYKRKKAIWDTVVVEIDRQKKEIMSRLHKLI
jgi:hypothetical protein